MIPDRLGSELEGAPAAAAAALLRQPVLDATRAVHGYELVDRSPGQPGLRAALRRRNEAEQADRSLLFVAADAALLASEELMQAAGERLVVIVATPEGDDPGAIAALTPLLQALRAAGTRLTLPRAALKKAYGTWLSLAAYVQLNVREIEPAQLPLLLRFIGQHTGAQAIASGVRSAAEYEQLFTAGVPLFQGDWFARPTPAPRGTIQPSQAVLIQMINMLQREADVAEIEPVLKRDPSLAFGLLRMINAANVSLAFEVTSLRHAMMMLGHKRLVRWAAALLATARAAGTAPAVASAAMVRGRLMELLAAELLPPAECDNAFVTGVFSLLDVLLDMPLAHALDAVALPEPVADALLRQRGLLAPFLKLTIACESSDDTAFAEAAHALHLDSHVINWSHLQALAWAEELASTW